METIKSIAKCNMIREKRDNWKRTAAGLLAVVLVGNAALWRAHDRVEQLQAEVEQANLIRDDAVRQLGVMASKLEQDRQARAEQMAAYAAVEGYSYIGTCTITAYCPCEECCGQWSDGLTATGLPAGPGIVAVDPDVVPLGSRVIIDGRQYLAADTGSGVKGLHIDLAVDCHQSALDFGVQTADVWVLSNAN